MLSRPLHAQTKDTTLENAEGFLTIALNETTATAITQARNGSQVFSALRLSRDPAVMPMFDRLRQSKLPENQVYAMIAEIFLAKDASKLDVAVLLSAEPTITGSAIAALIDANLITDEQLQKILSDAPDPVHRVMAAGELNRRKALKDRTVLKTLLSSSKEMVRHYAAITMLTQKDDAENAAAIAALNDMARTHDLKIAPVQAILMLKVEKDNLPLAAPWVTLIAAEPENDDGLRMTAVATLLAIKGAEGPRLFADMVQKERDSVDQIKLGLIAIEHADRLKPAQIEPLTKSKSPLAKSIAAVAMRAAEGNDITADVVKLIREGQPLVMDWSVAYSDHCDPARRMAIRSTVISESKIVDDIRGRDFERAALATQKILEDSTPDGRGVIAAFLKSDNRAVVEAVLAGITRSTAEKQAELVLPIWESVSKAAATETAANYAALILAREGRKEVVPWLTGMVQGGKVQNVGFRALAGWQYARLTGQAEAMLKRVLAEKN
jgi:hypothetical protein